MGVIINCSKCKREMENTHSNIYCYDCLEKAGKEKISLGQRVVELEKRKEELKAELRKSQEDQNIDFKDSYQKECRRLLEENYRLRERISIYEEECCKCPIVRENIKLKKLPNNPLD